MAAILTFTRARPGHGIAARMRDGGLAMRRLATAFLTALHEQRRREAARAIAHERHLLGLDDAARQAADVRPRVVRARLRPPAAGAA